MKQQFLVSGSTVIVAIISAIIVMIIHEFTKAIGYLCYIKIYNKKYSKNIVCPGIFRLHRYIDPIGPIFAVTNYSAFSKPYPYMIKSPKASLLIGLSGYLSMGLLFVIAIICHNSILPIVEMNEYVTFILHGLSEFIAYFCVLVFFLMINRLFHIILRIF